MNKIKDYYDKMLLAFLLFLLASFSVGSLFNNSQSTLDSPLLAHLPPFEVEINNGLAELTLRNKHNLMPGNRITVVESNGSEVETYDIIEVVLKRRAEVVINLKNGQQITGRLTTQDELKLSNNWQSLRQPLTVYQNRKNTNIPLSTIESITSDHKVVFITTKELNLQGLHLSYYQRKNIEASSYEISERPVWKHENLDENSTNYDLFTPPVIYLVNGKLTTNIPEISVFKEEMEEEFGMELIRFSNEPYPYRLVSWIGETPYFEDMLTKQTPSSSSNVRNRLEVGIPYKKNLDRQGGQPSLVPSSFEEEAKQLVIEKFVVQQYKDDKTGGIKIIGRALVKDFQLGGKSFEINNQMKEVYAGNIKIEVRMTLSKLENKTFTFTTSDRGISFDFGDRLFTVTEIDEVNKTILVTKKGPKPDQHIEKLLRLL